ncbi:MAG TPA: alpha/beta hydrolase [Gemmatimonadaceae bacterium]|nr:alpha/beta hydrolase [Gemmatimonadaceae bacterium]
MSTSIRAAIVLAAVTMMSSTLSGQASDVGHYADVNGIRMYYELHGTGQPLVLIHGGGSTIATSFSRLLPVLAKSHRVIAVELQAHGRTSDRNAPESFAQDADDVAELLRQLNIPKADILGFSNGGSTALQIAIRHPARVNRLIAISAIYRRDGMPPEFWGFMERAKFADMPQVLKDGFLRVTPDSAKLLTMFERDRDRMIAFSDWNASDLRGIQAPVLVVGSDQDVVRVEHELELSRLLPHGRLAIFPGRHGEFFGEVTYPHPESRVPELFAAMVDDFLAAPAP